MANGEGGVRVVDAGLVDSVQAAGAAADRFRQQDVAAVFLYVSAYAPSSTVLPVVQRTGAPVVVLNLQPTAAIDYQRFNSLRTAGLPQVTALSGEVKSYAERLFDCPEIGPLSPTAARRAIQEPVQDEGAEIDRVALDWIVEVTEGYPYFIQEWGKHAWNQAPRSPIAVADVEAASAGATVALDDSFFRVRFDRLTPREQDYLRAMAALGPGPHRSGEIADRLGCKVEGMGPRRNGLIKKGMVWSPAYGDTAFTVPMFDQFMRRAMPTWTPTPPKKRKKKAG